MSEKSKIGMSNPDAPLVLCVDGEIAALQVRALLLSIAGYRVLTARNGGDALRILQLNSVDLVIIDLWQPECTGTDVAREIKRIQPGTPVILLSGLMAPPTGEDVDLVLTKGITPAEFLEAIHGLLDKRVGRKEGARDEEVW
jgi:CheY-like chemotaxis protein